MAGDIIEAEIIPTSEPSSMDDLSPATQELLKDMAKDEEEEPAEEEEEDESDGADTDTDDGDSDEEIDSISDSSDSVATTGDDDGEADAVADPADEKPAEAKEVEEPDERFSKALARVKDENAALDAKREELKPLETLISEFNELVGENGQFLEDDPQQVIRELYKKLTHSDDSKRFEELLYDQMTATVLGTGATKDQQAISKTAKLQRDLDKVKRQQKQRDEEIATEKQDRDLAESTARAVSAFADEINTDENKAKYPFLHAGTDNPGEAVWGVVLGEYQRTETKLSLKEAALIAETDIATKAKELFERFGNLLSAAPDDGERTKADPAKKKKAKKKAKAASLTEKDASTGPGRKPKTDDWPEDDEESMARAAREIARITASLEDDDY